jgi:hypothetical protein
MKLELMRTLALRSGVLEEDYALLKENEEIEDIYFFQWRPANDTWLLPVLKTPEVADEYWASLDRLGLNNTREHKILNPQLKALYRALKTEINRIKKDCKRVNPES